MPNPVLAAQLSDAVVAHSAMRRTHETAIGIGEPHKSTETPGDHTHRTLGRFLHGRQLDDTARAGKPAR